MRNPAATFVTEKNKEENRPVWLYTIYEYDGTNDLRFAGYDTDVTYEGDTYTKSPIAHDFIGQNANGQIDSVRLTISNINREIQAYLESYDLRGKKVQIQLVFLDDLASGARISDTYYIDSYITDEEVASFDLKSRFDILEVECPKRKFYRAYCQWVFKSDECGYSGSEVDCNKTLQRCRALNNTERFGGFPSIPDRNLYV